LSYEGQSLFVDPYVHLADVPGEVGSVSASATICALTRADLDQTSA
jgi:hypothetical protein